MIMIADKYNISKAKMHSNCRLLPDHIACKITQINNMRRANTCDPALKFLNFRHTQTQTKPIEGTSRTGITDTTHTLFGRPYMVIVHPTEHLHSYSTFP